ncbi:MAG: CBS domain-containing protein [Sphingomonas sp.]|jgi:CBS domain-containing protein|uniref:CBS domain-containing protein n=1 Tax=Sphingomonas sp. TaxID=28214 RepID=UPI0025CC3075|nr:CBS domain-containing protein [Sphingomonas sp.]MBX9883274.1 CBS domain-containing protein [Sphingomonas sp.]
MTIAAILAGKGHEVIGLDPEQSVQSAAAMLADRRIGAAPVLEGGRVIGIFSERDVIHAIKAQGAAGLATPVRAAMTAPAITVAPADSVLGALSLMTRRRIRHLPVCDEGALVGFVSIGDLVKYRIDRIEADAAAMRDYIQSA